MIQVKISTNSKRQTVTTDVNSTVKSVLNANGFAVNGATMHLNGAMLSNTDLNASFADNGVADGSTATLIAVTKADSAVK